MMMQQQSSERFGELRKERSDVMESPSPPKNSRSGSQSPSCSYQYNSSMKKRARSPGSLDLPRTAISDPELGELGTLHAQKRYLSEVMAQDLNRHMSLFGPPAQVTPFSNAVFGCAMMPEPLRGDLSMDMATRHSMCLSDSTGGVADSPRRTSETVQGEELQSPAGIAWQQPFNMEPPPHPQLAQTIDGLPLPSLTRRTSETLYRANSISNRPNAAKSQAQEQPTSPSDAPRFSFDLRKTALLRSLLLRTEDASVPVVDPTPAQGMEGSDMQVEQMCQTLHERSKLSVTSTLQQLPRCDSLMDTANSMDTSSTSGGSMEEVDQDVERKASLTSPAPGPGPTTAYVTHPEMHHLSAAGPLGPGFDPMYPGMHNSMAAGLSPALMPGIPPRIGDGRAHLLPHSFSAGTGLSGLSNPGPMPCTATCAPSSVSIPASAGIPGGLRHSDSHLLHQHPSAVRPMMPTPVHLGLSEQQLAHVRAKALAQAAQLSDDMVPTEQYHVRGRTLPQSHGGMPAAAPHSQSMLHAGGSPGRASTVKKYLQKSTEAAEPKLQRTFSSHF